MKNSIEKLVEETFTEDFKTIESLRTHIKKELPNQPDMMHEKVITSIIAKPLKKCFKTYDK